MPSYTGPLTLTATTGAEFRATGEAEHLRRWLREVRSDMSTEACRQVAYYARELVSVFGEETPALVAGSPAAFRARLDAIDLQRRGYRAETYRHLLRAGRALHAAVHDLDTERARNLMDNRTPQRPPRRVRATQDIQAPAPANTEALPTDVQALLTAVEQAMCAQRQLDGAPDVRRAARAMLAGLSPAARLRVAARLPGAAEAPVTDQTGPSTLTELADEAIVAALAQRHAPARAA